MALNKNFPSNEELRALMRGELSSQEQDMLCERIRMNAAYDEFSSGIKLFLEKNQYKIASLHKWRNAAKQRIELQLIPENRPIRYGFIMKTAAAILISLGLISIFYFKNGEEQNWKKYYQTDPGLPVLMSGNKSSQWIQYYRAGNFTSALQEINNNLSHNHNNDTLLYYKLICLFETGQLNPNQPHILPQNSPYEEKANMMLAFGLWRAGKTENAMRIFNRLSSSKNILIREKASTILKENTFR